MRHDLKILGLVPVFGVLGAAATAGLWHLYALTLIDLAPPSHAVLGCAVSGLFGPLLVGALIWFASRRAHHLRWPAGVGLGLVLATELAFYVPLGFMVVAFSKA